MRVYATDDVMSDHARRSSREDCPLLHKFMAMDMDERWVNRSPETMLETFHWFQGEGFDLILEDVEMELDKIVPAEWRIAIELCWEPAWTPERMSERARSFMQW